MFHGTPMSPWPVTAGHLLTISGSLTVNALSKPFYRFDCTLCSTGPLCSLFLWSSGPLVLWSSGPLVLRCSGPLYSEFLWSSVLLILFTHCSSGALCSLFLWFFVLTVSVVLCAHCSSSFLYPLLPWSSVPAVPLVPCTHCSSGPLCPLFL